MERLNEFRNIMKNKVIFSSKKEVAIVIDDIATSFLDETMLRFPHIVRDIFKEVDNKSLTNCRNVSRACCDFIDNEKFYWVRKIQNYVSMKTFLQQWQKVLRNIPTKNIKDIFVTIKQFVEDDLNRKKKRFSPQFIAAAQGDLEFWKYTIERSNYNNSKTMDGRTAFHMAARNGCQEICESIIDHLEDKNPADNKGVTPFHYASEKGHFDVCKIIIQNIDNKNPAALDGCTPLHLATKHGHLEIVRLIVETGVDKSPIFKGKIPLDLVRHRSRYSFYKLLIDNISQILPRIISDILRTLCFLFLSYGIIIMLTNFFLLKFFCGATNKEIAQHCPAYVETLFIVPGIICFLLVAMIWIYLTGCIHKCKVFLNFISPLICCWNINWLQMLGVIRLG